MNCLHPLNPPLPPAPSRLQAPLVPDATFFSSVIGDAFAIAIVGYAITISMGKTFALKHGYKVDSNQVGGGQSRSHTLWPLLTESHC